MTGAGVPQFSAVKHLGSTNADVIADGGIRKPGDMVKALMAGADCVMVGSILGDTIKPPRQESLVECQQKPPQRTVKTST